MKKSVLLLLALVLIAAVQVKSQSNSVVLKNGNNVTVSSHSTIAEAYSALPATLAQAYTIELTSAYNGAFESYPITFGVKAGASPVNLLTLRPAAGVTGMTIQSTMATANSGILVLNDADHVVIDGRPGGTGSAGVLAFNNTSTASNGNTIVFINGACFNTIQYCTIYNSTTSSAGRNIFLAASASNTSGNSDNNFLFCDLVGGRYQFNSNGTAANSNTRNLIHRCKLRNSGFAAVWAQAGTAKITINESEIYCTAPTGTGLYFGIVFDSQKDSAIITNNRLYDIQDASTGILRYIHVRTTAASSMNFVDIRNNFFSMMTGNAALVNIGMIELEGTAANARIVNNSFRIGGTQTAAGTSGNVSSTGILLASTNSLSAYEVRNNIIVNERTGGTGVQHVALHVSNAAPSFTIDNNTYNAASGNLVRWLATAYSTIASYQGVVPGGEPGANDTPVQFLSANDLHLACTSWSTTALKAPMVPGVTRDIDDDQRALLTFRGADEGLAAAAISHVPCGAGTASAAISTGPGSFSFTWAPSGGNASSATGLTQGTYTVAVSDGSNCVSSLTFNIGQQTANFTATVTSASDVSCNGLSDGSASIGIIGNPGALSYTWSPAGGNSSTASGLAGGNYTVLIANSASCTVTQTLDINQPAAILIAAGNNHTLCAGDQAVLSATASGGTGALTYSWNGGPAAQDYTVNPLSSDVYTIDVTDANNCVNSATIDVHVNPLPVIVVNSGAVCAGDMFVISPTGGISYTYSSGSPSVTPVSSGDYTVTGEDANGCVNDAVSSVTVNALPVVTVNNGTICSGSSFTMVPAGASTYVFSGGSDVVSPSADATYTVTGTDANGCSATATSSVSVLALPSVSLSSGTSLLCMDGSTLSLSGTPAGGVYAGQHLSGNIFTGSVSGVFSATYSYTDAVSACSSSAALSITVSLCEGIAEAGHQQVLSLYPNPNNGGFNLLFSDNKKRTVMVIDGRGSLVYDAEIVSASAALDLSFLANGLYHLKVSDEAGASQTLRFIKQ